MHTSKVTALNFESRMENVVMNVNYSKDDIHPKKVEWIDYRQTRKRENRFFIQLEEKSISGDPIFVVKDMEGLLYFLY